MKIIQLFLLFALGLQTACAQTTPPPHPTVENPEFDARLNSLLSFTIPTMSVEELHAKKNKVVLFDTREPEEYQISHLPGALHLGYKNFDPQQLSALPKETTIVLYCSVGYRSEKIGEQIKKLGYTNVYNLYGSLFEWANHDYPLVDEHGNPTQRVHTYNRTWSKWVEDGKLEKVW